MQLKQLLLLALLSSGILAWDTCEECLPDEQIVRPGVGIDLTLDYGYAQRSSLLSVVSFL